MRDMPAPRPRRDETVVVLSVLGVSGAALAHLGGLPALQQVTTIMVLLAYAILVCRVAGLVGRILIGARPQI